MDEIKNKENFFIEGVGEAQVIGEDNKLSLIHLQDMKLELSSSMEKIFGGESNFALYTYQTDKGVTASFKNASWSLDMLNLTQGVKNDAKATLFANEKVTVGTNGEIVLTHAADADMTTLVVTDMDNNVIPVNASGEVDASYAGKDVVAIYNYTTTTGAIGSSVLTTSVPGYVRINHRSKAMKQKNGRVVRIYTTIYKARCDGSMTYNEQHKQAMAPELKFEAVDPERADKKFISFSVVDVTDKDEAAVSPV